jgi:endonuclease III
MELGLDLGRAEDRFKWFIASILFAKRISSSIAKRTFKLFIERRLDSLSSILNAGWDRIVDVLDDGGYVRYDFSTASNILEALNTLRNTYGDLEGLYRYSRDSEDLERRLMELKGVGPVAVNIFLRELRGIWDKADPKPSRIAVITARKIGFSDVKRFESQLVRIGIEYCKRRRCVECPVGGFCSDFAHKVSESI